jgi:hypothetical protein
LRNDGGFYPRTDPRGTFRGTRREEEPPHYHPGDAKRFRSDENDAEKLTRFLQERGEPLEIEVVAYGTSLGMNAR